MGLALVIATVTYLGFLVGTAIINRDPTNQVTSILKRSESNRV